MSGLWLENLAAFSLQVGVVAILAAAAAACSRIRAPRLLLHFHQAALAVALLAPALQPWQRIEPVRDALALIGGDVEPLVRPAAGQLAIYPTVVAWVLASGVVLRIGWLALGCWRLRRCRRAATPLEGRLLSAAGISAASARGVRWLASREVAGPATYGIRRPVIIVPARIDGCSPETARAMLLHELVHVDRRDWLFVLIEEAVRAALWFHPAVWWLLERIHLNREQAVDEAVVAITGDRRGYLKALLESAVLPTGIEASPAPAWLRRRHLKARILSAVKEVQMSRRRLNWTRAALTLALLSAAIVAATAFPLVTPAAAATRQQQTPQVYDPGNGVTLPVLVKEVRPQYTPAAMQAKIQGTVLLSCVVTSDGLIGDVTLVKSLDAEHGLDDRAVAAAREWTFKPGTKDGKPVAVRITIELRFTLK
jgi:TonB family protein